MSFMQKMIDETQMPITPEHPFKEKSTKLLILLSLRTIYNRTFQCETPCISFTAIVNKLLKKEHIVALLVVFLNNYQIQNNVHHMVVLSLTF